MSKCTKKSNTCLDITPASCTSYEGYLNEASELDTCKANIEDTTEELYRQIEGLLEDTDLDDVEEGCVDLGDKKVNTILKAVIEEICELREEVNKRKEITACDISLNTLECPLDLEGLTDECGEPMTNLNQLLKIVTYNIRPR